MVKIHDKICEASILFSGMGSVDQTGRMQVNHFLQLIRFLVALLFFAYFTFRPNQSLLIQAKNQCK